MHEGKFRRLQRIFGKDQKTLIVAMDHAAYMPNVVLGLEHPSDIIQNVFSAGANAVMTTLGTVRNCQEAIGANPLILSIDPAPLDYEAVVEQALCYGVDMIKCMVYPFCDATPESVSNFTRLATIADKWNMPIMAEVFPGGFQAGPEWKTIDNLAASARVVAEAGADIIKTYYLEEKEKEFTKVVENCPVPIVVLGGDKSNDPRPFFEKIEVSLGKGASGVAIGRNIWGHPKPAAITEAVVKLVHEHYSINEAIKLVG